MDLLMQNRCLNVSIFIVQNMSVRKPLQHTENGKKNNFTHTKHLMKMETPDKHLAHDTSNTLKRALSDSNYLKAMDKIVTACRNAIKRGLY